MLFVFNVREKSVEDLLAGTSSEVVVESLVENLVSEEARVSVKCFGNGINLEILLSVFSKGQVFVEQPQLHFLIEFKYFLPLVPVSKAGEHTYRQQVKYKDVGLLLVLAGPESKEH